MLRHRGGLFQAIDLGVDLLQRFAVRSAEILAAREVGNLAQRAFVDRNLHPLHHAPAVTRAHWHRSRTVASRANGVNLDPQRLGDIGGFQRLRQTGVVTAVREKNHHLAGRRVLPQSFHPQRHRFPDGGTVVLGQGDDLYLFKKGTTACRDPA